MATMSATNTATATVTTTRSATVISRWQSAIDRLEAAFGKRNDCLMRTFLDSVPEFHIPQRALIIAAKSYLAQRGPRPAKSSDLALILDHDASLVVPETVLEILTESHDGDLLKLVLPCSECSDPTQFKP